jgi:hypothetical protein
MMEYNFTFPSFGRLRQEDHEFKVSLGSKVRPCHKTTAI